MTKSLKKDSNLLSRSNLYRYIRIFGEEDYWFFNNKFFNSEAKSPDFHKEIIALFDKEIEFAAAAAPRGFAKTTCVSRRHNLWLMLYAKEPYILLISDTYGKAVDVLKGIEFQLTHNELLRRIFKPVIIKNKEDTLTISTIYGRSKIVARSTGQSLRGIIDERENRPTLIVCDDLEEDSRVKNAELRTEDLSWFWSVLIPARAKNGRLRVVGTILHPDSLLNKLIKSKDWESVVYKAIPGEGKSLWPEYHSYDYLVNLRDQFTREGQGHKFYCEYQNDPVDPDNVEFKREWIQYGMLNPETIKNLNITTTVDLAISKKESACYTAITTCAWGMSNPPFMYVLDARRGRWGVYETLDQLFEIRSLYAGKGSSYKVGIERVAYQQALEEVFKMEQQRRGEFVSIEPLRARGAKEERIRALFVLFARGQVWLTKEFPELLEEVTSFPNPITWDLMDALAYQLQINSISARPAWPKVKKSKGAYLMDLMEESSGGMM